VMRRQRGQQDQARARRRRRKRAAYASAFTIEIEGAQYAQLGRQRDAIAGQKYQSGAAAKAKRVTRPLPPLRWQRAHARTEKIIFQHCRLIIDLGPIYIGDSVPKKRVFVFFSLVLRNCVTYLQSMLCRQWCQWHTSSHCVEALKRGTSHASRLTRYTSPGICGATLSLSLIGNTAATSRCVPCSLFIYAA
jgi:hypothetical protein